MENWFKVKILKHMSTLFRKDQEAECLILNERGDFKLKGKKGTETFGFAYKSSIQKIESEAKQKFRASFVENLEESKIFDHSQEIVNKMQSELSKQIDNIICEGLNRKGFVFTDDKLMRLFIEVNCRAEMTQQNPKKTTFFVKEEPFLVIEYNTQDNLTILEKEKNLELKMHFANFRFI